jgi:hypothetical protein
VTLAHSTAGFHPSHRANRCRRAAVDRRDSSAASSTRAWPSPTASPRSSSRSSTSPPPPEPRMYTSARYQHSRCPVLASLHFLFIRMIASIFNTIIRIYASVLSAASTRHHSPLCIEKARTAARLSLRRSLGDMYPSRGSYSARGGLPSTSSSTAASSARPGGRFGARTDENRVPTYMRPTTASTARSPADVLMKDAPAGSTAGRIRSAPSSTPGSASSARLGLREHASNGKTSWSQCVILRSRH